MGHWYSTRFYLTDREWLISQQYRYLLSLPLFHTFWKSSSLNAPLTTILLHAATPLLNIGMRLASKPEKSGWRAGSTLTVPCKKAWTGFQGQLIKHRPSKLSNTTSCMPAISYTSWSPIIVSTTRNVKGERWAPRRPDRHVCWIQRCIAMFTCVDPPWNSKSLGWKGPSACLHCPSSLAQLSLQKF